MDVFLENNAPVLIDAVSSCGYPADDVQRDPWNTAVFETVGFTVNAVNSFMQQTSKEVEAVIAFASTWDIDPYEWGVEDWDAEKRLEFALQYIAALLERDSE